MLQYVLQLGIDDIDASEMWIGTIHSICNDLILKYIDKEDGLNEALQANAMVGGDNASRSIAIGMVLGAFMGIDALRKDWLQSLDQYEYCEELLSKLPLFR